MQVSILPNGPDRFRLGYVLNEYIVKYQEMDDEIAMALSAECVKSTFEHLAGASLTLAISQQTRLSVQNKLEQQRAHYRDYINRK